MTRASPRKRPQVPPPRRRLVGAYEAKTHLSSLLEEVEKNGVTIAITRHGKEIAEPGPAEQAGRQTVSETLARLRQLTEGVRLGGLSIRSLIDEGRRF